MPPQVAPHQAPPRPLSLHDAARAGEERSVKQLVDELPHPSAVDDQDELNRETALHVASFQGHSGVVKLLLDAKSSVNATDMHGSAPLHMACWKGQLDAVKLLMAAGAVCHTMETEPNDPHEVVTLFVRRAQEELSNHLGFTPLDLAELSEDEKQTTGVAAPLGEILSKRGELSELMPRRAGDGTTDKTATNAVVSEEEQRTLKKLRVLRELMRPPLHEIDVNALEAAYSAVKDLDVQDVSKALTKLNEAKRAQQEKEKAEKSLELQIKLEVPNEAYFEGLLNFARKHKADDELLLRARIKLKEVREAKQATEVKSDKFDLDLKEGKGFTVNGSGMTIQVRKKELMHENKDAQVEVWLVENSDENQLVLKLCSGDEVMREVEARRTVRQHSDTLVQIICAQQTPGMLLMERADMTLRDLMKNRSINDHTAKEVIEHVLKALIALHIVRLCHLDIKPENVVGVKDKYSTQWKLIDLGSSAQVGKEVLGMTDKYAAPEVAAHFQSRDSDPTSKAPLPATERMDIFSAGVMLLEMVTNREVFDEAEARHRLASLSYYESKIDYSKAAKGGRGFMKNMGIGAKKLFGDKKTAEKAQLEEEAPIEAEALRKRICEGDLEQKPDLSHVLLDMLQPNPENRLPAERLLSSGWLLGKQTRRAVEAAQRPVLNQINNKLGAIEDELGKSGQDGLDAEAVKAVEMARPHELVAMISYTQRNPKAKLIAQALHEKLKDMRCKAWLDVKGDDKSEDAMKNAVKSACFVIAIITGNEKDPAGNALEAGNAYFERDYCLKELRWAKESEKFIQPVVDVVDKVRIGEFMRGAPEDLRDLSSVDFVDLNLSDLEYFSVGVGKILRKAMAKNAFGQVEPRPDAPSRERVRFAQIAEEPESALQNL